MNRISYNILAALVLAFFIIGCAPKKVEQANVLLIMADDLGFSDLGCYGGEIKTPNLDKLASGGLRFTQFNNCGRCWPSRAALLSGFYPQQIGPATGDMVQNDADKNINYTITQSMLFNGVRKNVLYRQIIK